MNKKLEKIGSKLNVSKKDIKKIKRKHNGWSKISTFIIGAAVAIIIFILGILVGRKLKVEGSWNTYPFAVPPAIGILAFKEKGNSKIGSFLASIASFLTGLTASVPIAEPVYGVYSKKNK